MLSRYQGKEVRITAEDGSVFTGTAEVNGTGYGLHEFNRAEESIQLDDVVLFRSDIRKIEELPASVSEAADPRRYDDMMGRLLDGAYWIADILPAQVPANAPGQYFAVERYYLRPDRLCLLHRKQAEILLRLNCYYDMDVSFDSCMSWEKNPEPEEFAGRLSGLSGNDFLRAVFAEQNVMIDIEPGDTYMTVYDPDGALLDKVRALAAAEGFFVWSPPQSDAQGRSDNS